jgi:hypothetical protein
VNSTHPYNSVCPHTAECLRLLDEIDTYNTTYNRYDDTSSFTETTDDLHIEQLAQHLKSCPICQHAVARIRQVRNTQRHVLRSVLLESESLVPPVTNSILTAIRQEAARTGENRTPMFASGAGGYAISTPRTPNPVQQQQPKRSRTRIGTFLALTAAAVIILASIGLFGLRAGLFGQPQTASPSLHINVAPSLHYTSDPTNWPSVLLTRRSTDGQQISAENYDATSSEELSLIQSCCTKNIAIDGIAHSGQNMVYRIWDDHQTYYHLLSGQTYTIPGHGSNAVWSTNDTTLYASTADTLYLFNTHSNLIQNVKISLHADRLEAYQKDAQGQYYLYFSNVAANGRSLFRIATENLSTTTSIDGPLVTTPTTTTSFWFSPGQDNKYIYYNLGLDIYQADLDNGSNEVQVSGATNAIPVGYAANANSSLMFIRQLNGQFQLVQVDGADGTVIIPDIARDATSLCEGSAPSNHAPICDSSIAMNPFTQQLVVGATYPDGSYKVSAIDFRSQPPQFITLLTMPNTKTPIQLIGWDRILSS